MGSIVSSDDHELESVSFLAQNLVEKSYQRWRYTQTETDKK